MDDLQEVLAKILSGFQETIEIVKEKDMISQVCKLADPSETTLTKFENYLKHEFGLAPKIIFNILEKLSLNVESKAILGRKIMILWLKYKIFKELDIMKKTEEPQRNNVSAVLEKLDFGSSSIDDLIRNCIKSNDGNEGDLPDVKQMIIREREAEINSLFVKVTHDILEYNPDKSIEQQLADFISDYKYIPEGLLEKILMREQIIAFLANNPQTNKLIAREIPELKDEKNNFSQLKCAYNSEYGVLSTEISQLFRKLEAEVLPDKIYPSICALKQKLNPINVLQLERLVNKTNDAKKQIQNKDVIFILGTTGSGKSTNILKFLSYTLKEVIYKGLPTLIPVQKVLNEHRFFHTSPLAKSCTRYINAAPIPAQMYPTGTQPSQKTLVICDSPGFGDNGGVQVDIANGVGMINALHGAKSVRVVVLLAYDAITSNRSQGTVQIGKILSNLFQNILDVSESIAIYFNKVPKEKIQIIPNLVKSTIENLIPGLKADEKLGTFLEILCQRAYDITNYIDPLRSNYKELIKKLSKMQAINKVRETFRYEFTDATKREINNLAGTEKVKIKDYFKNQKYIEARFHFKMLEKLKDILYVNDKVKEAYSDVAKFIQNESIKEQKNFEQYLIQICNGEDSDRLSLSLKACKKKLEAYEECFHDFEQIVPVCKEETAKIIQEYKDKLLRESKDLTSFSFNKIFSAVKIFSRELAPQLQKNVVDTLTRQFNQVYKEVSGLIEQKAFLEMGELVKTLKSTAGFISNFSTSHSSHRQMQELMAKFASQVDHCFEFINENILKDSLPILHRHVISTKNKLADIENIEALKIIDDSANITKKFNECIKRIINKCKADIRELDTIDFSIASGDDQTIHHGKDLKSLSSKKSDIELLMEISNVGEVLRQDYEYTKENVRRKLDENVEILNNCINALRGNNSKQIEREITNIKKATEIVLKCSQLVDQAENSRKIATSISGEFLNYISTELQAVRGIQVRLSQIDSQSLKKISIQYKKHDTYSKMASIDHKIQIAVLQLRNQFNKTLKNPFIEFKGKQINYLNEKNHYKFLIFSLERYEKLCYYSNEIQQIVSPQDYNGIRIDEDEISLTINKFIMVMRQECQKFLQNQNLKQLPQYLKDLIKTLITLNPKTYTCLYLSRKMEFDVSAHIDNIKSHLFTIKNSIDVRFSQYYETSNRVVELTSLVKICRFYMSIEDALKIKDDTEKLNFRELQKAINKCHYDNLKGDEEQVKDLIVGIQPSKISWNQVKAIYSQFYLLKTHDGTQKRGLITKQLRIIQSYIIQTLRAYNGEIADNPDLIIKDKEKMNEFLEIFKEAIQIQRQLTSFYVEEDKNQIIISNRLLKEIGSNIIDLFKSEFESVKKQLTDYNNTNIKQKINNFGNLQSIIHNVFLQQDSDHGGDTQIDILKIKQFIEKKKEILNKEICEQGFIEDSQIKICRENRNIRLKMLLHTLHIGISQEILSKYENYSEKFVIDNGFKKYYTNYMHPKDPTNEEHKKFLFENVDSYFTKLYSDYKEKSRISAEQQAKMERDIIIALQNLPSDLKKIFNESFKQIKEDIKAQNDGLVQVLSQKIVSNPNQIGCYLQNSVNALKNGQKQLHDKLVEKIDTIFTQKSRTSVSMADKIAYINDYFLNVSVSSKQNLENDPKMQQKLKSKLKEQLRRVNSILHVSVNSLKKFVQNPIKAQEQSINARQSVTDIFLAHSLAMDLSQQDQSEFKMQLIKFFQERLINIADIYNQTMANYHQENLSSIQILANQKMNSIQSFIEYLNSAGDIIEFITNELEKLSFTEEKKIISKATINKYLKIDRYAQRMQYYENQIKSMLQYANDFQFYDDRKKSMTVKDLEASLQALDHTFEILKQRQEFFNKFILNEKSSYEINTISTKLFMKFNMLVNESKTEVEDTFKDYNSDPASKINLLMNFLKIMKEKKFKFIAKEEIEKNNQELSRMIRSNFEKLKQRCAEKIKVAREKTTEVYKEISANKIAKTSQIIEVSQQIKKKIEKKTQELTRIYDQKIAAEQDEKKKKDHENGKKNDINSFKNDFNAEKQEKVKTIEEKFTKIINDLKQSLKEQAKELAQSLTLYKKALLDINYDNEKQVNLFEAILEEIPKGGSKLMNLIQHQLETNSNDEQSIGKVLLTTNKVFEGYVSNIVKKLIMGKDIDYVLNSLQKITLKGREQISKSHKAAIKSQFQIFKRKYQQYKELYQKDPQDITISLIVTNCRDLGAKLKKQFYQSKNPSKIDKIQLLSGIFALWTIQKAEKFEEEVEYTIEPHPTQITALILLLGISHDSESISNKLAQVGTGEGKSIVLAGLSCYLALCGFKVRCACYSSYLSGRDSQNFRRLFEKLAVQNDIKYGTFNQLCEDILNQGDTNFKEAVKNMISEKPQGFFQKLASILGANFVNITKGTNKLKQNPTILVIDEVDVFFDDNFFGNTYCPAIKLSDQTVTRFLEYVWTEVSKKGHDVEPKTLIKSKQFSQMVEKYPSLDKLLQNQVHGMISGALSFKHDYFLIDKKLVYKDNDAISPNISYGYKTVFANIYEHYKGAVSRSNFEEALQISLMVAEFSYAMLPQYFDGILGVTGTLEVLPQYKKKQLKDRYHIEDQYAIPSAFGVNNRRKDNYFISPQDSFHRTIIAKINEIQDKRPIIIFFKGVRELNDFSRSPWFESYMKRTFTLTEEHQAFVRDNRIVRAVNADSITLMTNSFGRGTDFMLLNQTIKDKGGMHVIQAFLSHEESEEVQIKGRTARQSNEGSYDCILSENWLEELGLTSQNIPKDPTSDAIHKILLMARQEKIDRFSQTTLKLLEESDKKHQGVIKIFAKESLAQSDLIEYIFKLNNYPEIRKVNIKTVLGLDATGSMGEALKKTCEIIANAFERTYEVLSNRKVTASIEIKIMIYRNYNSPFEEILETTSYQSTPHNLRRFLDVVRPKGGWGNEALEVFFQSLNKDEQIDQVILIGDAAPNTSNEVTAKRADKGENYWNSNGFPATNIDKELERFALKKSPVHSFYLNAGAAFNKISKITGGKSSPFALNSSKVTDELTAFVVENVLQIIQKRIGTKLNLVETYRKMFV